MSGKLKIYACSGIGNVEKTYVDYWLDGTNTIENTQAVNTLLVQINALRVEIMRSADLSDAERINLMNEIDWRCVALNAAKRFHENPERLLYAGKVISAMAQDGRFEYPDMDDKKREDNLEELYAIADQYYSDQPAIAWSDPNWQAWWDTYVMKRNRFGLNHEQQQQAVKSLRKSTEQIKGIGEVDDKWKENEDLSEYMLNASSYFLYTYFTKEQLAKLPDIFRQKKEVQKRIYNYCKGCFVDIYGSEEEMRLIIESGIKDRFGQSPEWVCNKIATDGKMPDGVGEVVTATTTAVVWTVGEIISLISAILTFLGTIIVAILSFVSDKYKDKYGTVDREAAAAGTPNPEDFEGLDFGGKTGSSNTWITMGIIGVALLLMLKK